MKLKHVAKVIADTQRAESPIEDLSKEHGLLNRMLLIYDAAIKRGGVDRDVILATAVLIRSFVEDYHEEIIEEQYVFPLLRKANQKVDLVNTLEKQHDRGRALTDKIMNSNDSNVLVATMQEFVDMYRPHESREETEVFPWIRQLTTPDEYRKLGEEFEKIEVETIGVNGFSKAMEEVITIEKRIGINVIK